MEPLGKRLTILSNAEIQAIYSLPKFNNDEQQLYFSLNPMEQNLVDSLHSIGSKISLIILLGYFKAKQQLFSFDINNVENDFKYIKSKYFPNHNKKIIMAPSTIKENKRKVLKYFNYNHSSTDTKIALRKRALNLVKFLKEPASIFSNLLDYCEHNNYLLPKYSTMQLIISKAILQEEQRLEKIILQYISSSEKIMLNNLITSKFKGITITELQKEPRDFSLATGC